LLLLNRNDVTELRKAFNFLGLQVAITVEACVWTFFSAGHRAFAAIEKYSLVVALLCKDVGRFSNRALPCFVQILRYAIEADACVSRIVSPDLLCHYFAS